MCECLLFVTLCNETDWKSFGIGTLIISRVFFEGSKSKASAGNKRISQKTLMWKKRIN